LSDKIRALTHDVNKILHMRTRMNLFNVTDDKVTEQYAGEVSFPYDFSHESR